MQCQNCKKNTNNPVDEVPSRHACSPLRADFKTSYCSKECATEHQKENYAYWADIDRNASDGECFEHERWDGKYRVGRCKITGQQVRVEPMQPGNNSGQPKECEEHFVLNERYRKLIQ